MKLLPVGIQTFSELIENNYVYVDKTREIHTMVTTGKIYFLSRPRRFGKSLLLSTLESLFKGEKELFEGLYIYDKWIWERSYPVVHLDMSEIKSKSSEILENSLINQIKRIAKEKKINLESDIVPDIFVELIDEVHTKFGKKVVVLVDEYDAPLVDNISDEAVLDDVKEVMNSFYKILKSKNEFLRFVFLTGVSKFSGVSVFSGLNNLDDITLNKDFSTICGYTENELESYFDEYIDVLAYRSDSSYDECLEDIKFCYDGYSWDGEVSLYNPYSTLKLFRENEFSNYWFSTGTTSLLMRTIKNRSLGHDDIEGLFETSNLSKNDLMDFESVSDDITALLFQTGYLTIEKISKKRRSVSYFLGFPNMEVKNSFYENLLSTFTDYSNKNVRFINKHLHDAFLKCDEDSVRKYLQLMISRVSNNRHIAKESFYQDLFLVWLHGAGFKVQEEVDTNIGILDGVIDLGDIVVVCEIKFSMDKSFDELIADAFQQIYDKKYYTPYIDKEVFLLAVGVYGKEIDCKFKPLEEKYLLK
ncbi:MAG: AAA family ATPase [Methanobrevibacter sp. CfCl-M3]